MTKPPPVAAALPVLRRQGQEEPRLAAALQSLTATLSPEGLDHAEIELVNWGDVHGGDASYALQDIALGDAIEIAAGTEPSVIFRGEITALEERYGEGAPKLVLLVENALHTLSRKRRSQVFEEQSIDAILSAVIGEAGLSADVQVSSATLTVHQLNESDLALLRRLARPFGAPLRLEGTTLRIRPPEPPAEPVVLDAQDNALRVRITADLARQFATAQVGGYNVPAGELVDEEISSMVPAPSARAASAHLQDLGWPSEVRLPWPVGLSSGHARDLAQAALNRQGGGFLRGDVVCEGDPRLAPGGAITLQGVSSRLAGTYAITAAVHRFDRQRGYECLLSVSRAEWSP